MNKSGKFSKLFDKPVSRAKESTDSKSRVGRPPGKRSNKDFQSVTLFLSKKNYAQAQDKLTDYNREQEPINKRDVSTLVDYLLSEWLKAGGKIDF